MSDNNGTCQGRVLVVEDEPRLSAVLRDYLEAAGYVCQQESDGGAVLDVFSRFQPELVILDLNLPTRDGIAVCRDLRARSDVPVIMVTARIEEIDRLLGLEVGADDYVCKPFSPREVIARVRSVLKRHRRAPDAPAEVAMAGLCIDDSANRVTVGGRDLELTQIEFRLLRALASQPGRTYSRDQLMDHLYADRRNVLDRTVDSHIRNLRRKLGLAGCQDWVRSVYGIGYRFEI